MPATPERRRRAAFTEDIDKKPPRHTQKAKTLHPAPAAESPFILVVDDEEDLAESLADFFRQSMPGVRVQHAATGVGAMHVMAEEDVDVIVTDLRMPGMDGLAVLRQADELAPNAERIVISGFSADLTDSALKSHKVARVFAKPFDVQQFVDAVDALMAKRKSKRRAS